MIVCTLVIHDSKKMLWTFYIDNATTFLQFWVTMCLPHPTGGTKVVQNGFVVGSGFCSDDIVFVCFLQSTDTVSYIIS